MKKIASIFLALLLMLTLSVSAYALTITYDQSTIPCIDFLDFADDNMYWATPDENGKYPVLNPTENSKPTSAVISDEYDTYLNRLDWSLTDDNEVLHLVSNSSESCGMAFKLGEFRHNINIGLESAGAAEYIKIRIRNTSASTKISFAWQRNGLSGWTRAVSTLDIAPNMTGWYEMVINIRNLNIDTNTASTRDGAFWGAQIKDFCIFPFGYNGYGGAYEGYEGASMDIDYIVIGSYDYVTNYQSDLQIKEGNAVSFEPVTLPEKTTYYIGETLDLTGFQGKIDYKDGTTEYVDKAAATYNFDEPSEKTQVTLKYGEHEFSYDVKVVGVDSIEVDSLPNEKIFNRIEILQNGFKPEGLTIKVNYADDTTQIKELRDFKLENTDFPSAGDYIININFYGSKTSFNIKVIDIEKLQVVLLADKVYYGTVLDLSQFDVTCIFTDESEVPLDLSGLQDYFAVECDTAIPGGKTTAYATLVNSAYNIDLAAKVPITVQTPVGLKVTKGPALKFVTVDSTLDTSTMNVSYVYDDGVTAVINNDDPDLIVNYDFSVPGVTTNLKIKAANGLATTYEMKVRDADFSVEPGVHEGTVYLLSAKFPTFWLVFIIVAAVIVLLVVAFCILKFVLKVDFKPKRKRASFDDIF